MDAYSVFKAIHFIALVSWFAAMFYLPRLFVYHAENIDNREFVRVVKIMERKLFNFIGIPAFVLTLISGVVLLCLNLSLFHFGWLHTKLTLLVLLIAWFFWSRSLLVQLANDTCKKSGKFFRVFNEIPTLFLIAIVLLAVLKPF